MRSETSLVIGKPRLPGRGVGGVLLSTLLDNCASLHVVKKSNPRPMLCESKGTATQFVKKASTSTLFTKFERQLEYKKTKKIHKFFVVLC